uniref:Muscle M-line assembly protein unc-89 n=1 Tax=Angiostrongylus cantonensis TaxID=6313 RepID=A0A0K0DG20_ANGCA
LRAVQVKETETINLSVTVTGAPTPKVTWFKDDVPIEIDNVHILSKEEGTGHFVLTIHNATVADVGRYSCKASSEAGEARTEATVHVTKETVAPQFAEVLRAVQVKETETINLSVTVTGAPTPKVTWFKDDVLIEIDNVHILSKEEGTGHFVLTIHNATVADVGRYSCKASNEAGEARTEATVHVTKETVAPQFTEMLRAVQVKETETINLSVTVTGAPTPKVTWFKDDVPIEIDNVHILSKEEGTGHFVLTIHNATVTDIGRYSCRAFNDVGEARTEAMVRVGGEYVAPQFTEELKSLEFARNTTFELAVTVTGTPQPNIVWLKDGLPVLLDDVHVFYMDEASGRFTLTIKDAQISDVGMYSCVASNVAGKAQTEAQVFVVEELTSPHFVEALKSLEVEEGQSAELFCSVVGTPEPEITWLKDGVPVQIDHDHFARKDSIGGHSLIIKKLRVEDVGSYSCEAVNRVGKDVTIANVKIPKYGFEKTKIDETVPLFIEPLKECFANEGETVILECRVNKESQPEILWFKDNVPIALDQHMIVETLEDGKIKLTIHNVAKEDTGSYRCEAVNKAGRAQTEAKLQHATYVKETVSDESEHVSEIATEKLAGMGEFFALCSVRLHAVFISLIALPWNRSNYFHFGRANTKLQRSMFPAATEAKVGGGPAEFVELLRSCTVTEGQQAVLKCKVKGEPRPKIKWTKDGKESEGNDYQVEMTARIRSEYKDDGSLTLTIDGVTQQDAGEYRCHAENEHGSAWTEGPIAVVAFGAPPQEGEAPDFVQPIRPVLVAEGETAVLEGKVSGKPKPSIKWYKNGEDVKPSEHFVVESLDDGTQRLTVKNVTMDDMDEYRCSASNDYGDVWSDVTLSVKSELEAIIFITAEKQQEAPSFTKTLVEVSIVEGESATYECKVTGEPQPEIKWFKDKEEISTVDEHFAQTKEGDVIETIDIQVNDSGEIRCEASNTAGTARTAAPLTVTLPEEEIAPKFTRDLTACQITEGEVARFECKVKGTPLPLVRWFKDGEEVKPGDGVTIEALPDGTNKLTINDAKLTDQGNYRVEATNVAGSMSSKAPLSVQAPETLKLRRPLHDITVEKGTKIQLTVEVEGQPKTVKWYKESKQVTATSTTKIERVSDAEYKLEVENCETSDSGAYRVVLSTESESIESKCVVTVKEKDINVQLPSFKSGLKDQAVPKGQPLVLEVEIEGKPRTVKWYKNGDILKDAKPEDLGDGKYRLTVPDFKESNVGEYSVVAENEVGEVESKAKITMKEVPDDERDKTKPEIVTGLVPTSVKEGETATFSVKVKGPVKTVKYKNGKEIPDANTKDNGDGVFQLIIPNANKNDTADYRVVISNDAGDAHSAAALTVKLPQIEIVKGLEDIKIDRKQTGVLAIETNRPPKQVKWYKNGKEITPSDKAVPNKIDDKKYQLSIPDADKDDTANYKVVLTDDDGNTAESACALTVKVPAAIELVKALEDTVVPKKQTGVLEIQTNKPAKMVKYKNGREIAPSDKAVPKTVADNKYQLSIPDADKDDCADYKVVLTDDDGNTAESSCVLTVKLPGAIEFVRGLEDTVVLKKQSGVLEEITPSDKDVPKVVADNKYQLTIPDADKDDTATYKIVLTDDDGNTAESSCALTVKLPEAIEIVKALEDIVMPKKQTAALEIQTNKPAKVVKWYKNGKEIAPSDKAVPKAIADNKYQLSIPDVGKDDTANYKVVLMDDDGNNAESACALTVKLPAGIEIVKGLEDTTVPKGKKATLEVQTNRAPKQVKWYKDGKELTPSDKPEQKTVDDNKYQLVIPNADDVDAADYKVVLVDDDDNSADSSCALTVRLRDKEPKIIKGLDDRTVAAGLPTIWELETEGSPRTVKWYKNGKEIAGAAAAQVKMTKVDDNRYVLEIPKCALGDTGSYKVEVENDAGKASSTGKLTVEQKLTFLIPLKDQTITEGETVEFKVETNAKPNTVKWYKNGETITPDARFIVTGEETKYRLVIKNATRNDTAEYKVVLSNSAGDTDSSAKLTVLKAKPGLPKIVKQLDDQIAAKGTSMVFEVKVEGEVDEVRWFKDTIPITAGTNAIIEKVDDTTYRLTIPIADIGDVGHYSIDAVNESGKASSDAKGEVDEKPEIVKGLVNTEVCQGDDSLFKVEVSTPVRTVKWYKNGQEVKPSKHFEPKKIGPKKYELAINRAELDDCANFKVVLANAAGECDSSAELTVTKPNILKLLESLKDIDVNEGEPINLKVRVEGIPKTVKWYKNGAELSPNDVQMDENVETGEYSLVIPQSKKSDGAGYRISLVNEKGEIYSGAVAHVKTVKAKDATSPVNFLSPLEDTEVAEGDMLTLKCVVAGIPFPELTWTKDGVELEKDDRIAIRVALDGTATLRIRDCRRSDFGQYRITAKNECSTETSTCQPRFIIPLKSCEAEIGEKKEFEVKVRGFPKPTLEWLLNGSPIDLDGRCSVTDRGDGVYYLTIRDVRDSDFGTFRCIARNEVGKDECQAEFGKSSFRREKEDDRYPPRFNVPLWDRRIPVNDPLSIECHVDAKPVAQIEWFKDGKKLEIIEGIEIRNTSDGACRVRIARFGKEDVGVYMCVATNPLGVADTRSTYSVEVTEKEEVIEKNEYAPRFNPGLEDLNINAGQSIRLSCTVDAIPKAGIVWYKDGLPLRSGGRFTITTQDDGTCILEVKNTVAGDEGAYRCVASNEHGTTNTSCLVTVKVPKTEVKKEGEEPFFTKGLVDMWTDRGETFTLKCAVKGDPFPEIKWFRNGTLVRDSSRTRIETAVDGSCLLTVKDCTMSDEGVYRCEAENKHGKAKTQATAHVQMSIAKTEVPKLEMGSPPRFIIPLEDQTVVIGGVIDLDCKVTGEPMPQVKWSKDGGPIWEDSRYEWEVDEAKGTYHLRITSVNLNDEGTYRCVATNESGSVSTKSFVRIDDGLLTQAPAKSVPPRFTIHLGDARAVEGQPLQLECKVEGSPLPELTWHKDGAEIHPSDRVQMSMGPDGVAKLVIPQCCMDDEGIYRVIATNPSGSAHDKGTATVKKAPRDSERRSAHKDHFDANKLPKLIEPLENVKVPEKEGFKLRCKFSGEPKLAIKWFKDGERVFPYGRLELVETDDGVCELLVESSIRQDAGGYRCVAENQYGSVRTTCEVTVIQKERKPVTDFDATLKEGKAPGFTVPLTVRRAKPGENVTFECVPYGNPFPEIKWLKDGIELSPSANVSFESLPDGTQRLHLVDVNFFNEGFFRCVATNEYGTASTKAELSIDGERMQVFVFRKKVVRNEILCEPKDFF